MADPKTNGPDPMQLLRRAEEALDVAGEAVEAAVLHIERPTADRLREQFDHTSATFITALRNQVREELEARLLSDEVIEAAARSRFIFSLGRSYDSESEREQMLSREIAAHYLRAAAASLPASSSLVAPTGEGRR